MQQDLKNLILAMGLSLLVIVGWNHFYGAPKIQHGAADPEPTRTARRGANSTGGQPGGRRRNRRNPAAPTRRGRCAAAQINRAEALAQSPRIVIDTKSLFGTIALKGARLDDIALKNYRETTDPKSPNIVLLSPSGAPDGYFIDLNYVAPQGVTLDLPKSDTLWKADGAEADRDDAGHPDL